jgi:hypothetical protein
MTVRELMAELHKFPADTEVTIYAGVCCDVQSIHRVHFQPSDSDSAWFVVLADETIQDCIPGHCNCSEVRPASTEYHAKSKNGPA